MHLTAIAHLRRADPILAAIIARVPSCTFAVRAEGTHVDALLRAIVYQQLSGSAAVTILGRVVTHFSGRSPTPAELLATPDEPLRAAGLSRQKIGYARDLMAKVLSGEVPLDAIARQDDETVITELTRVKGIGRWTAQMFLMFRLGRPDVFPELDLGIRNAIQRAYRLRKPPTPERMRSIAVAWSPHRTIASWYLWRSLDLDRPSATPPDKRQGGTVAAMGEAKKVRRQKNRKPGMQRRKTSTA
ncbi:MAG: DNA-3-methyladenine glycosylase 2 family protein [Planctomycetes bacterium]|nr:DNA-3-methyladenine glycosylase 2 family protein [Planctomycetota bacterium]